MSEDISQHIPHSRSNEEQIAKAEASEKDVLADYQAAKAKLQDLQARRERSVEAEAKVKELEKTYREKANISAGLRNQAREDAKQAVEQAKVAEFHKKQNEAREATIKNDLLLSFVRSGLGSIQDFEARYSEIRAEYDRQQITRVATGQVSSTLGIARRIF